MAHEGRWRERALCTSPLSPTPLDLSAGFALRALPELSGPKGHGDSPALRWVEGDEEGWGGGSKETAREGAGRLLGYWQPEGGGSIDDELSFNPCPP